MSTRTQAALLMDAHHPFPEPLIPDGIPKEVDTTALQAAITAWEGRFDFQDQRQGCDGHFEPINAYRNASNYGVGVYEESFGVAWSVARYLNKAYARQNDGKNASFIIEHDLPYWHAGYLAAKTGRIAVPIGTTN